MKYSIILVTTFFLSLSCTAEPKGKHKKKTDVNSIYNGIMLPAELKEISGMTREGESLWAISDAPIPVIYKLDKNGKIVYKAELKNITVTDMESLTSDEAYIYIGDIGNNKGKRASRSIIKIPRQELNKGARHVNPEVMTFNFDKEGSGSNYNCEAVLSYKDSLYLFTKEDNNKTQLYVLPKKGGRTARRISAIDAGGLITGAGMNQTGNEIALTGYRRGHRSPFILLLNNFSGNNFFSGTATRYELDNEHRDWQVESISYIDNETLNFACEGTKDVDQSLYTIKRSELIKLPQTIAEETKMQDSKKGGKDKKKKKH